MINILHIIDTTGPGGAETVFTSLVKGLDTKRFFSVVVIRGPGWVADEIVRNGVTPIFLDCSGSFNVTFLFQLIKVVRTFKIDIIQSHLWGTNVYTSLAGILCGVKVVSTYHGFVDIKSDEKLNSFKRLIVNAGSTKSVYVSERLKSHFLQINKLNAANAVTIYNGVDTVKFHPARNSILKNQLGLSDNDLLIGAVGNIRDAKGYQFLLAAARHVVDCNPRVQFVVAGEGAGNLYHKLIKQRDALGLADKFHFIGFQPDPALFLNNLDVFVLSSTTEGFSIATIEAMACGVPVVVTYSGGPEEIVENGVTGSMVPPANPGALARALLDTIESPTKIAFSALRVCREKFALEKMVGHYERCYQEIYGKQ